jgi:exopolyphosphatase/guanosine-5'-triphosphate,3'-diphosphate pyrophosphatase
MSKTNNTIKTAVIDVGTLKSKFEVREYDEQFNSTVLTREKELTVLGRDLDKNDGMIIRKAIDTTVEALNKFKAKMQDLGVHKHRAVTTEAIRKAKNSKDVLDEIKDKTGIGLEVLTHDDEAKIYFNSVSKDFPNKTIAVSDIGGGSVQVVIGRDDEIFETHLFKTGTYFMQENLSKTHHPTKKELANAKKYVKEEMKSLAKSKHKPELLVYGTTNIIDFLNAMKVNLKKHGNSVDHPYRATMDQLLPVYDQIVKYPYEERMSMFPAEPYYMWSAENALINIFQICDYLSLNTIIPSNNNISSGILHELAKSVKNG